MENIFSVQILNEKKSLPVDGADDDERKIIFHFECRIALVNVYELLKSGLELYELKNNEKSLTETSSLRSTTHETFKSLEESKSATPSMLTTGTSEVEVEHSTAVSKKIDKERFFETKKNEKKYL